MISIEIPVLHGKYLRELIESIRSQTFQDYEVIVVNSSTAEEISDLIKQYGFKEVKENVKLLKARYLAHINTRGEYSLLLDETRILRRDALKILSSLNHDMVIIGEEEIGNSFWIKLANLDKENIMECNTPEAIKGFVLPRYFRNEVLVKAFMVLRENLKEKFDEVIFPDHELLYYEASKVSNDVFVLKDKLIMHYGDSKLSEIVRKYYRYGKSLKVLNSTPYEHLTSISRKKRNICKGNKILLYLLYVARGIPFLVGYLL
ncbi:glycosyltransferase [Saccharolobus solfataricus]|uniref:Glycosyltransferase n=2 Tax=Saccharolobus solfataricus TaxID=2287 RepID=A0A0E3K970_SACSO|nr:glycosyltransferase [Saccharolobus solfataricus]AKA74674.1 glycosyltransferase [Saccharolobus solfataricus]AKA77368.1 glycosyltransferase [Saccharolobus solfataricus]AKA80059.1 glycosyltransferase [Saccharolobus solfataricus]AZF69136.1 glycosyltransferase [Saccharolobus solfataricus]AZF71756.1 glycosyltransferase [Saccharolobus solfataricus]